MFCDKKDCEAILKKSSREENLRMLQEECGELVAAINHELRKDRAPAKEELIEELVDVGIMLDIVLSTIEDQDISRMTASKMERMRLRYGI